MRESMKRLIPIAALILAAGMILPLGSCTKGEDKPAESTQAEITIPKQDDQRTFTSVEANRERLESAFRQNEITAADQFDYTITDDGVKITAYKGGDTVVRVPERIEDKPVTIIAEKAFAGKGMIHAIDLPDTVEIIGVGAFENCGSLSTLRTPVFTGGKEHPYFGALFGSTSKEANSSGIPAALTDLILTRGTSIPDYAFYDCHSFVNVALPDELETIGNFAFYGCRNMIFADLFGTRLTAVGDHAFANCAAWLRAELPATVTSMGISMLEGCASLEQVTVPFVGGSRTENRYIGYIFGAADYAFTGGYLPKSLITITLLEGCGDIPANGFYECLPVRAVEIPAGVTEIGPRAFYGSTHLQTLCLPDSVRTIGADAFHGCIRLREVTVGSGLETLGVQAFMECLSLEELTLPAGVTALPNSCFAWCRSLETLRAPGVKTIGERVFDHCDRLSGWADETESA